ncbi:glycoside hydrolase family 57 protein [Gammaproteobacteria bacterium AB-CW1]|uniref:Glycoside hydrolase family 57 protein n=1 Tax=Natronospira elongata TaxID=3110268 RepID=A0AAP6JEN9_9GAMM|nr:glycoside hydrolase family 57 protein [Gammaproteobacteria bacterium AB-CW1]
MSDEALRVVLCWHMHQPEYRDAFGGQFLESWTYLHAIKDYADMAAHLEQVPDACAVFDFSPILLDQLEDYSRRLKRHQADGTPIGDRLLDALAHPVLPLNVDDRRALVRACLQANRKRLIERFPPYRRLADMAASVLAEGDGLAYLEDRFILDLLVWFHLAWLGETLRRDDRRVDQLLGRAGSFTYPDRQLLLSLISDTLQDLLPRYRRLLENDRIELASCPWGHPILPLLLDFQSAREARPESSLPLATRYPGGRERVRWHLDTANDHHRRCFGRPAQGCWPAEGAICRETVRLLGEAGFAWAASGQAVLCNSLGRPYPGSDQIHRPWQLIEDGPAIFFRDDGLSDLIGFTYKDWHADDAVANFIHHLETIAMEKAEPGRVVSVILDGENAWEHYPDNGYHFIGSLYRKLLAHPDIELTTFSRCLRDPAVPIRQLKRLRAGSWVHGNLDTWMGDQDKNRAWEMLVAAKQEWDRLPDDIRQRSSRQLAVCEGSDWFWWPGDYNPEPIVARFERLYRRHLADLYRHMDRPPPDHLEQPFSRGGGEPEGGGTMRPAQ